MSEKKVVDFTNPHLKVAVQVLVKDGSPIQSVKDLEGKKSNCNKGYNCRYLFNKEYEKRRVN